MMHIDGIYFMKFNKFRASNRLVTRNNYIIIERKMFGILNLAVCVRDEFIVVQAWIAIADENSATQDDRREISLE